MNTFTPAKRLAMSTAITLIIVAFFISVAQADSKVTRQHTIPADDVQRLTVQSNVGAIEIKHHDKDEIYVELALEGGRTGFFRRKQEVGNTDLTVSRDGNNLTLSFDEDGVNADWVIYTPQMDRVNLKLGVGNIRTESVEGALVISLGVGDVTVRTRASLVGHFEGDVGVGGITARGIENYTSSRRIVAETSNGRNSGSYDVQVDVGVGDIKLLAE